MERYDMQSCGREGVAMVSFTKSSCVESISDVFTKPTKLSSPSPLLAGESNPTSFPTNIGPAALQRPATQGIPATSQPLGGTEVGCRLGLWRACEGSPPPSLLIHPLTLLCASPVLLHWLWPPTANLMPSPCLLHWQRVGLQPSATGWL